MEIKYNIFISDEAIHNNLKRIVNQIYKLLPMREEGTDWQKPLSTIMEELSGLSRLMVGKESDYLTLLSKLQGLYTLTQKENFMDYRRIIFQCLSILNKINEQS